VRNVVFHLLRPVWSLSFFQTGVAWAPSFFPRMIMSIQFDAARPLASVLLQAFQLLMRFSRRPHRGGSCIPLRRSFFPSINKFSPRTRSTDLCGSPALVSCVMDGRFHLHPFFFFKTFCPTIVPRRVAPQRNFCGLRG